jgi:hypothetical protein
MKKFYAKAEKSKALSLSKNLYELDDRKAKEIIAKLLKKTYWHEKTWIFFILQQLEKDSLEKGIHPLFLKNLKRSYLTLKVPGRWLSFCENLEKKWFQPEVEKSAGKSDKNGAPITKDSTLFIAKDSKLWENYLVAIFCAESLYQSENWENFLIIRRLLSKSLFIKNRTAKDWLMYEITALYKTGNFLPAMELCQKNWLTVKNQPITLESCALTFKSLNMRSKAKEALGIAYDLSKDKKFLFLYADILLQDGEKEKAAKILLSIQK